MIFKRIIMKYTDSDKDLTTKEIEKFLVRLKKIKISNWRRSPYPQTFTHGWEDGKNIGTLERKLYIWVKPDGTIKVNEVALCKCKDLYKNLNKRWERKEKRRRAANLEHKEQKRKETLSLIKE